MTDSILLANPTLFPRRNIVNPAGPSCLPCNYQNLAVKLCSESFSGSTAIC